jgi:hypothetical protein
MNNLEIALSYLEKGLAVIPLYSPQMLIKRAPKNFLEELKNKLEENAQSENPVPDAEIKRKLVTDKCKHPLVEWKEYQTRLPSKEDVTNWFTKFPLANIGIVTGVASNLVVFDLDSQDAIEYINEIGGLAENTAIVNTGKGQHIYVRHPGFDVSNQVNTSIHIDVRGDGGLVAAPPSFHGSGRQYQWIEGSSIFDIDPAPCTDWMIDYLKNAPPRMIPLPKKPKPVSRVNPPPLTQKQSRRRIRIRSMMNFCLSYKMDVTRMRETILRQNSLVICSKLA